MGSFLLDTHVFLWWRTAHPRIKGAVREAIEAADTVYVSAISAWEIALKVALGRLIAPSDIARGIADSGFQSLAFTVEHAEAAWNLPFHHRDPFDRMMVAQAKAERLTLVTADRKLERYGVPILWA